MEKKSAGMKRTKQRRRQGKTELSLLPQTTPAPSAAKDRMTKADWKVPAALADALAPHEGAQGCQIEGVTIVRHSHDLLKVPVLYEPSLVFVVQGTKKAVFGSRTYVYAQVSWGHSE